MSFHNRPNEPITLPDGRLIWHSRSSTVVVNVWCIVEGVAYVLIDQRGPGLPDEVGKWNLPCGYLDWDETLPEAAQREVFEETGVDIRPILKQDENILLKLMDQPWQVLSAFSSHPQSKQNVAHHYALVFKSNQLPAVSMDHCEPGEVTDIRWICRDELGDYDFAFNHERVIDQFVAINKALFTPYG